MTPVSVATVKLSRNQAITGSLSGGPETPLLPRLLHYDRKAAEYADKSQSQSIENRTKAKGGNTMSIIKVNIPGDAWVDAKAGENVIAKLGYERLSWIRVVTERPVDLTIKTQTGDDRRTTRKEPSCNCFATEKNAQYSNPSGTFGNITGLVFDEDTRARIYYQG